MKLLKNKIFIAVVCLVLSFGIAFVAFPIYQGLISNMTTVVIATQDIEPGTLITEGMLQEVEMSQKGLPSDVAHSKEEVMFLNSVDDNGNQVKTGIQMYAATKIMKGYFITSRQVAEKLVDPMTKIRAMKFGETVITVPLANAQTVELLPNDIVRVYYWSDEANSWEVVNGLNAVSLVCFMDDSGNEILQQGQVTSSGEKIKPTKAQFILNQSQAEALMAVSQENKLWFSLLYRGDDINTINSYLLSN